MADCLFCKIAAKQIAAAVVFENDRVVAFRDIGPQAPVHILVIPRRHVATVNELDVNDRELIGDLVLVAKRLASEADIAADGYRLVLNCNRDGGQSVFHVHLHLLGGRAMAWPPG